MAKQELDKLPNIYGVDVTRPDDNSLVVTFFVQGAASILRVSGESSIVVREKKGAGSPEIAKVYLDCQGGAAAQGFFRLRLEKDSVFHTTASVSVDSSAADLKSALEASLGGEFHVTT